MIVMIAENTRCQPVLRAKHLLASALVAMEPKLRCLSFAGMPTSSKHLSQGTQVKESTLLIPRMLVVRVPEPRYLSLLFPLFGVHVQGSFLILVFVGFQIPGFTTDFIECKLFCLGALASEELSQA